MTHIIILAHFVCITMGSILFYELLRNMAIREKNGFLVAGIGIMNVSFILYRKTGKMSIYPRTKPVPKPFFCIICPPWSAV